MTNNLFPKLLKSKIFCREYRYSINEGGDKKYVIIYLYWKTFLNKWFSM